MKEIISGLFLGSLEDVHDVDNISKNGISHILTVDSTGLPAKLQDEFTHKGISLDHVFMLDTLDFELCTALQNALQILNSRSPSSISVVHWYVSHCHHHYYFITLCVMNSIFNLRLKVNVNAARMYEK